VRVAYWLGKNVFEKKGLRPYIHLGGGVAQVDAKLPVTIVDCSRYPNNGGPQSGTDYANCANAPPNSNALGSQTELDAYKKLGQSFIAIGGGAVYALSPNSGLQLNLNLMYMLPTTGQVIEPTLGYVFGI